tara:strand:- start:213 stop:470 length:258 start_codon:yes stop_codon:yes gene_type:complete
LNYIWIAKNIIDSIVSKIKKDYQRRRKSGISKIKRKRENIISKIKRQHYLKKKHIKSLLENINKPPKGSDPELNVNGESVVSLET